MKTISKVLLVGSGLALAAGTTLAYAAMDGQGPGFKRGHERMGQMGKQLFQDADTNKDGAVSRQEMQVRLTERFTGADSDGDSTITKAEIVKVMEGASQRRFMRRHSGRIADHLVYQFDLDEDGNVTFAEIDNRTGKFFALLDRNDDGKLEMAEIRHNFPSRHGGHKWRGRWRSGDDNGRDRGPDSE